MRRIDTHCHLGSPDFQNDREEVLERAQVSGIDHIVCITDPTEKRDSLPLKELQKLFSASGVSFAAGVHPHNAKFWLEEGKGTMQRLLREMNQSIVAIGEIGLDFHYELSPREAQKQAFREQLFLAGEFDLPVIIHTREALQETWDLVTEAQTVSLVLHCCSEPFEAVKPFIDAGYYLSFTGIVTFPKSDVIRDTAKRCPLEQLLIETDSPFLAPVPHRGKRNEPAFILETAKAIASLRGISLEALFDATTRNAERFFGL